MGEEVESDHQSIGLDRKRRRKGKREERREMERKRDLVRGGRGGIQKENGGNGDRKRGSE